MPIHIHEYEYLTVCLDKKHLSNGSTSENQQIPKKYYCILLIFILHLSCKMAQRRILNALIAKNPTYLCIFFQLMTKKARVQTEFPAPYLTSYEERIQNNPHVTYIPVIVA